MDTNFKFDYSHRLQSQIRHIQIYLVRKAVPQSVPHDPGASCSLHEGPASASSLPVSHCVLVLLPCTDRDVLKAVLCCP